MNTAKQAPDLSQAEAASSAVVQPVEVLAEEFLRRYRQGEQPTLAEYLERYPELAEQIRAVFPALIAVEQLKPASSDASAADDAVGPPLGRRERIGAYRLLRVLGRGGMGVVYEAEHESLGRRVALKVLPVDVARDAKLLARFRRESRAAAQLHHSNIVPVFEVGQEGDIFFYAMQYIPGQPVDAVIQELQRLRAASGSAPVPEASAVARSLLTGRFEPAPSLDATLDAEPETSEPLPSAAPVVNAPAALSGQSELSMVETNYRLYCRNVARLGMQVAEALAYAHGRGIVHRDIKPSNLLLDTAGLAWVSDFGLAKTQEHALTETGDLVGTLRYMAPERFQGVCDAQADVYALGLTLYELLLLRPAFDAPDRLRLIDQIGHQEPARPRTLDPRIPRDLETILMKAIEKEPRRRYQSAEALAGDLRRFLADEPIQARRIGPLERLGRWGRRNPLVASLSAAIVLVAALGFVGVFGQMQVAQANEQQAKDHAKQVEKERDEVRALNKQLRRTTYAAHMNLAKHAWDEAAVPRVLELLEQYRPKSGEPDLRGFEWFYLYRLCHAELLTFKGHTDRIRSVLYSPDGKRLASVDRGGTVKVWDAQSGRELLTRKGGGIGMAFSPDGKRLAVASPVVARGGPEGTVTVWDAQTGQELLSLKGHTGNVESLAFSPDGKRLASVSRGWDEKQSKYVPGEMKLWDAQTGQELLSLKGGGSHVTFILDGKRLASAGVGAVKVWDAQTGQELLSLKADGDTVAISPDGKRLAGDSSGSGEGWTVKVWDAQTGQVLLTLRGHNGQQVNSVTFSRDGKRLASAGGDRTVKVWDAQTGQVLLTYKGHIGMVRSVVFSPDGTRLASIGLEGTIKVWDATTGPEARTFSSPTGYVRSVAFSSDGKRLATGGGIWDDTKQAYVAGELKVRDAQTGQELFSIKGLTNAIRSVAFSPDGKRLAGASEDQTVKVWDVQTGQELLSLKGHTAVVSSLAFSPDGKRLASGSQDKTVKVWDAQTGQELLAFKGHSNRVGSVAFSPDGTRLVSAAQAGAQRGEWDAVKVWDAQTGQELLTIKGQGRFPSVAFSPDGKRLASSWHRGGPGAVGEVQVWDAQTGQELLSLKGHTTGVSSVVFSPDGKRLASGSGNPTGGQNGEVKVWDAQTGQELLTLKRGSYGHSVAFSPNGYWLASVAGGTVKIYDATPLLAKP